MEIYSIVILADGLFPTSEQLINKLRSANLLICCDGAIKELDSANIPPHIIIGDMDSISQGNREKYSSILHVDRDQESNDLTKAVQFSAEYIKNNNLQQSHSITITILGATGKREDHTIGNISLLPQYAEMIPFASIEMLTDFGRLITISNSSTIISYKGASVSIFSFDPTLKIKSAGLEYPTDNVLFDFWWKATLNVTSSDSFSLEFSHPAKVVLFIR